MRHVLTVHSPAGEIPCMIIERDDPRFRVCIALRVSSFFQEQRNPELLINDEHEAASIHLVAMIRDAVGGYARLTMSPPARVLLSQVVVAPEHRGDRTILKALLEAVRRVSRENGVHQIVGNARKRAVPLFQREGFRPVGQFFPSKKTGIPHMKMVFTLSKGDDPWNCG